MSEICVGGMNKLCQFSTIVFAGNVSILLIVSVTTDYWVYRGFQRAIIQSNIRQSNTTQFVKPLATESYFAVRYFWRPIAKRHETPLASRHHTLHYQSPAAVVNYFYVENVTSSNDTETITRRVKYEDLIVLFVQYGNLFRECTNLEAEVRQRLGFMEVAKERCHNFITNGRNGDFIQLELPAVIHIERAAFVFAVTCIVSSVLSFIAGAVGSLLQDKSAIVVASSSALISGICLVVSIALFHGKCHLLRRRDFMSGLDIPYKRALSASRVDHYGWSFVLAWICVVLCFLHSWAWLGNSQDLDARFKQSGSKRMNSDVYCQLSNDVVLLSTSS